MAIPEKLSLDIVTPERRVIAQDVDEVILPGVDGLFGVLPGHAALLAQLGPGLATVRVGTQSQVLAISGGFADIGPERVTVLAETCERGDEVDRDRARQQIALVLGRLGTEVPEDQQAALADKLRKEEARLAASDRAATQ